jgi:putative ABC transport system permease protein
MLGLAVVDEGAREGLAGDLAEEYLERRRATFGLAAGAWYWRSVFMLSIRYAWERIRHRAGRSGRPSSPDHHTPAPRRGDALMQTFLQDLRIAIRSLRKAYGFTAVAVLTLAVGVGANTAMFSTLNAVLMTPLPYEEPERLLIANTTWEGNVNWTSSAQDYEDYREQNDTFEVFALMSGFPMAMTATGGNEARMVTAQWISWDLFRALGVAPVLGRGFRADEADLESAGVAIISHDYWQASFGGRPDAIGTSIVLNGTPVTIVGVMPAGFRFYYDIDAWLPYRLGGPFAGGRQYHNWVPIGRLAAGATLEQAQSQFDAISARLQAEYPDTNEHKAMQLSGLHESMVSGARPSMMMLTAAVALLLLIACANVANLLLAKGSSRQGELAVRAALGAGRGRLVRQLLTESLVIAILAGVVGIGLALWLQQLVVQIVPVQGMGEMELGLSWSMLGFAVAASILTSLLFGMVPALQSAPRNLSGQLKGGARGGASRHGARLRSSLVVAQVALSLVLLVGAGLLIRSFASLLGVDDGFNPDRLLTAEIRLNPGEYEPERGEQFFSGLVETLEALPGVTGVAVISQLPVRDPGNNIYVYDARTPPADLDVSLTANTRIVLPGYFETMEIPLLAGRTIRKTDTAASPPVMVINQTMAETMFPGENALGQRVVIAGDEPAVFDVVGVVGDVRMSGPASTPRMSMYRPYSQSRQSTMRVAIRTAGDPSPIAAAVRGVIRSLDANIPVGDLETMESIIANSGTVVQSRVAARSLGLFAVVALLLASVGLYGVLAYFVSQRNHEIGVRMALGAEGRSVTRLILKRGLGLVLVGLAVGTAAALFGTRLIADQLFEVGQTDPATYIGASLIFLAVAVLACVVPVWRALRIDPLIALRSE